MYITVQTYIDKLKFSYKVRINRWLGWSRSGTKPDVIGYVHHDNWLTVKVVGGQRSIIPPPVGKPSVLSA